MTLVRKSEKKYNKNRTGRKDKTTRMKNKNETRKIFFQENKNEISIAILVVILLIVSPMLSEFFLSSANILNLLRQTAYTAIAAIGMYFVILIGGIDLSIGSTIQIVGMASIIMLNHGYSMGITIVSILLLSVGCGLINGILVTIGKLQPFVVTLVMKEIMAGIVLITTGGASISGQSIPDSFMVIGTGYIGIVPIPVIIMILVFMIAFFVMKKMIYGRLLFVCGSNRRAAYNSGVNVCMIQISAYVLCSLCAAVSGLLIVARTGAFQPSTTGQGATGMEMNAIAAVVIGGATLAGGVGTVTGTMLGALLYGILANLFPLIGVSSYLQQLIQGLIILVAVIISVKDSQSIVQKMKVRLRKL